MGKNHGRGGEEKRGNASGGLLLQFLYSLMTSFHRQRRIEIEMKKLRILRVFYWVLFAALTALLFWNSRHYLDEPLRVPFVRERGFRAPEGWTTVLVPHVMAGMICLIAGPPLFLSGRRLSPGMHRGLGILYAVVALAGVLPTGMWLSLHADGGTVGRAAFALSGAWMAVTLGMGLRSLARGQVLKHRAWMIRSFAMMTGALSFRVVYVALFQAGLPYATNYPLSGWLSTLLNAALAEMYLCLTARHNPRTKGNPHEPSRPLSLLFLSRLEKPRRSGA